MQVRLLAFGVLKELLGKERDVVSVHDVATVADLLQSLAARSPHAIWPSIAVAVNQEYVRRTHLLHDNDEVALLPPVSGGGR
jgi:molybdopterin converting factor subunit 1